MGNRLFSPDLSSVLHSNYTVLPVLKNTPTPLCSRALRKIEFEQKLDPRADWNTLAKLAGCQQYKHGWVYQEKRAILSHWQALLLHIVRCIKR